MSAETIEHLNTFTLIGGTDWRGRAWHYRESAQGDESNHYPRFIPTADVLRRLFNWKAVEGTITATHVGDAGMIVITADDRKAMIRPPKALGPEDPGGIMGIFKSGYQGHDYEEWLIRYVESLLDDELGVTSAGVLAAGAQAWVEVSVPETFHTPSGVDFRPNLLCTTSFDGTLATTYKRSFNSTVCDNTRAMVLAGAGEVFRVKHTKYSNSKLTDAHEALAMVHTMADDFTAEVEQLTNTTVTDSQWTAFLDSLVPLKDDKGKAKEGRGLTMATTKRAELERLYQNDTRCAPWKDTAFGVIQTVNTYTHHVQSIKGKDRSGRNATMTVTGAFDKLDQSTWATLEGVLAPA